MESNAHEKLERHARVCVPIRAQTFNELELRVFRAENFADVIELRLDSLPDRELSNVAERLSEISKRLSIPIIVTFRPADEGGYRELTIEQRKDFWHRLAGSTNFLFDTEQDLAPIFETSSNIICSYHDFTGVTEDVDRVYERLAATGASILKIAVYANDAVDCLPIFRLLERAENEGRQLIALAMGDAGLATRILGPSRGAYLTYAAIEQDLGTAPGQLTAEKIRSLYRIDNINRQTRVFGLVGSPVMHSISPHVHNAGFDAEHIDAVYLPFEVKDLKAFIERMVHPKTRELNWDAAGFSVTAPHKLDVMSYLDWIDERASEIGAVNTIVVDGDKLRGYNTDVDGFIEPLTSAVDLSRDSRVAVIGAGGAANAALWSLKKQNVEVVLFARDVPKAQQLADNFEVSCEPLSGASFESFDVVVNATPLGSLGAMQDQTTATADQLRGVRLVYDLVYNPIETRFLREAKAAGCKTLGGMEMLVAQARRQFKLWTGKDAPAAVMKAAALRGLQRP